MCKRATSTIMAEPVTQERRRRLADHWCEASVWPSSAPSTGRSTRCGLCILRVVRGLTSGLLHGSNDVLSCRRLTELRLRSGDALLQCVTVCATAMLDDTLDSVIAKPVVHQLLQWSILR